MEALIQKASNLISAFPVDSAVVYHKDIESPALQQFYRLVGWAGHVECMCVYVCECLCVLRAVCWRRWR